MDISFTTNLVSLFYYYKDKLNIIQRLVTEFILFTPQENTQFGRMLRKIIPLPKQEGVCNLPAVTFDVLSTVLMSKPDVVVSLVTKCCRNDCL